MNNRQEEFIEEFNQLFNTEKQKMYAMLIMIIFGTFFEENNKELDKKEKK